MLLPGSLVLPLTIVCFKSLLSIPSFLANALLNIKVLQSKTNFHTSCRHVSSINSSSSEDRDVSSSKYIYLHRERGRDGGGGGGVVNKNASARAVMLLILRYNCQLCISIVYCLMLPAIVKRSRLDVV